MVIGTVTGQVLDFLSWDEAGEAFALAVPDTSPDHQWPPTTVRAPTELRALADGSLQLLSPTVFGARLTRLGHARLRADVDSPHVVLDAVLAPDGFAITLEYLDAERYVVRGVDSAGTETWVIRGGADSHLAEVSERSRLLADAGGRVFLSNVGSLWRVDEGTAELVDRWQGMAAVWCPDGTFGYARYDPERRALDWVTTNPDTGRSGTVVADRGAQEVLSAVIGVDRAGRVYGGFGRPLGRMSASGELDWLVDIDGVTVSEAHGVTIQSMGNDGRAIRLDTVTIAPLDDRRARLIGRTDTGYVLHQPVSGTVGTLVYLDADGRVVNSEPAPENWPLTYCFRQRASVSSVTAAGSVVIAAHSPAGVHLLGLAPEPTPSR
ncbi:hypothetical protein [Nocardia altamirensis]|uniref:hypothetical protein n=1 Tax=Nocardia altamirensis TaxID=472158 RepID=UPI0008409468|nr:hypothetical protein [Nocardia altamirensis]